MNRIRNNLGFSLVEMLIATGIMAIGLVMVATVFPVGVKLTTLTTERTIGAVAADEAFAKIQLYGLRDFQYWPVADPNLTCTDFEYVTGFAGPDLVWNSGDETALEDDFQYPSSVSLADNDRNYHWSALCRRVGLKDVQVTVFVSRKIAAGARYRAWDYDASTVSFAASSTGPWPKPIPVYVDYFAAEPKKLVVKDNPAFPIALSRYFFDGGYTIIDNLTGQIYRVSEVEDTNGDNLPDTLVLVDDWHPITFGTDEVDRIVWVVPPAVGSDRYPCVGVYQKVIRFDDIN